MYLFLRKTSSKVIVAVVVGLLAASLFTRIGYSCIALAGVDCDSGSKFAILHPIDSIKDSAVLKNYFETFLLGTLVSFVVINFAVRTKTKH